MNPQEFVNQSDEIKTSYLVILGAMATVDRENTPEEIAFTEQMANVAGLSEEGQAKVTEALKNTQSVDLKSHLEKFKDNDLKYSLVTDLLNMSYADGDFEAEEVDALKQINMILDVNEEQYEALQNYVKAANKEVEGKEGNVELGEQGEAQEPSNDFLEKQGLLDGFKKAGIPTNNFLNGSTIGSLLTSAAFSALKGFMSGGNQGKAGGGLLGGLIGSMMGGGQTQGQGQQGQGGGLMGSVLSSMLGGGQGAGNNAALTNILGTVMGATGKGKGLGNLMDIIGGGKQQQKQSGVNIGSILGSFMGGK